MYNLKTDMPSIVKWVRYGIIFGYPECCITEFVIRSLTGVGAPNRKLRGTGYIPCIKCDLTKTEAELIATIQSARLLPTPFPEAGGL